MTLLELPTLSGIHAEIEATRRAAQPEAHMVRRYRQYARGRQRGTLTAGQQRILRGLLANRFCDNVCNMVLQQIANRMLLRRYAVGAGDEGGEAAARVETFLRGLWTMNQLGGLSAAVHYATLRDGNHAVMLAWSEEAGRVVLTRERWYNGATGIFVAYDDAERPKWAVKDWKERGYTRRTIYRPGEITRYIGEGSGWRPYRLESDPEGDGPIPWLDAGGGPLGLPVVHFAARDVPSDGDEQTDDAPPYGMSVLDGGMLGLQDEINDIHRDIDAAARFTAYQLYYATGITPTIDSAGTKRVSFSIEPGSFLWDENVGARYGTLPAGSIEELDNTLSLKLQAVARNTGVPQHLIAGEWPSGEALLRSERALIDRAEALIRIVGPSWASVGHKSTRLANRFGLAQLDEELLISSVFEPTERRDASSRAAIAGAEAPYVSKRQTLRTLGYAPDEIERIMSELALEATEAGEGGDAGEVAERLARQANAAGILIRSGFEAADALRAVGLDPIKHSGLLPVTLQTD